MQQGLKTAISKDYEMYVADWYKSSRSKVIHVVPADVIGNHRDGWRISGFVKHNEPSELEVFKATCGNKAVNGDTNGYVYASDKLAYNEFISKYVEVIKK